MPIHVDAASGGFVAPILQPDLEWDFRLPRVQSINASGHKYGLVYPGVGWAIWRNEEALPRDLVFDVNYLGGHMPTFALNFSRPGSEVVAQYFMFTTLGREGYRPSDAGSAERRDAPLERDRQDGPVPADLRGQGTARCSRSPWRPRSSNYTVFDVSDRLRQHGWLVPAYTFPANRQDLSVLRIVIRAGMTMEMADHLLDHLREETEFLESLDAPLPRSGEREAHRVRTLKLKVSRAVPMKSDTRAVRKAFADRPAPDRQRARGGRRGV